MASASRDSIILASDDKVEIILTPPTTSQVSFSGFLGMTSLALMVVMSSRGRAPPTFLALVAAKSSQWRALPTLLWINTIFTHSREGDTFVNNIDNEVDDSALHNSQVEWELSKMLLLPWDLEERKSLTLIKIISNLFLLAAHSWHVYHSWRAQQIC